MSSLPMRSGNRYEGGTASGNARVHNGNVYVSVVAPDQPETSLKPLFTVPFKRDPNYVHRGALVEEIYQKLSVPGARVALVGLGGVGKSQLAIEYAYQVKDQSPETWVFWLHASSAARFELSVRDTLEQLKVPEGRDPKANAFQLFRAWLRDAEQRKWLLILDNADDVRVLLERPPAAEQTGKESSRAQPEERCIDYLLACSHGFMLVTTRSRAAAELLVERNDVINVGLMQEEHERSLLAKKLGSGYDQEDIAELVRELECMPLAMTQAAAYITKRAPRCSVQTYVEKLKKSNKSGIRKRVLGSKHPDTLASMGSLALTYQKQGLYEQAAELGGEVLEIRKRVLGPEHPETLTSMSNLAHYLYDLGREQAALDHMRHSAGLSRKVLGDNHVDTRDRSQALERWTEENKDRHNRYCAENRPHASETVGDEEGNNKDDGGVGIIGM